jgi:flagellar biosynthetic protein FliO
MDGLPDLNLFTTGLKTGAMLLVVLGLLVAMLYAVKRFLFTKRGPGVDLPINVLSTRYLSQKERIAVVEISGEKLVLGIAPGYISFLVKLDPLQTDSPKKGDEKRNL